MEAEGDPSRVAAEAQSDEQWRTGPGYEDVAGCEQAGEGITESIVET